MEEEAATVDNRRNVKREVTALEHRLSWLEKHTSVKEARFERMAICPSRTAFCHFRP